MSKKAVLFDLNGTLIDRKKSMKLALEEATGEFTARWIGDTDTPMPPSLRRKVLERAKELLPAFAEPTEGAKQLLDTLSAHYRLAVVSNGRKSRTMLALRSSGLNRWFPREFVFTSAKYERMKPNPYLFRKALRALDATAEETVMIGDSWRKDCLAAARLGIDAIWINASSQMKKTRRRSIAQIPSLQHISEVLS